MAKLIVGVILWIGLAVEVCAQMNIDSLVVVGKKMGNPGVGKIATDLLQPGSRADAAELLRGLPGVQADSRSNYAQDSRITLRGFGARSAFGVRGVDLQIDGIPLTMPDGQGQLSGVMLDDIAEVNLVTGPLAALYGNAAGGVINLRSRVPTSNRIELDTATGAQGLVRNHVSGEFAQQDFSARLQASQFTTDGDRPHSAAERKQVAAQLFYQFENGVHAQWRFDKEKAPELQDPLGLTQAQWQENSEQTNNLAEIFNTRKGVEHQQQALSFRQEQGAQRWQLALWKGNREIQQFLAQKGDVISSSGGVVDLQREFSGVNANYTADFLVLQVPSSFTLGGEWASMDDQRKGYVNNNGRVGDLRRDELNLGRNRDVYVLLETQLSDAWRWLAGVRHSHISLAIDDYFIIPTKNTDDSGSEEFNANSATLATQYKLNEDFSLRAALGKGFETPTLTEIAYTNGDKGFNQNLLAATNRQYELGVNFQHQKILMNLAVFAVQTQNELVVDQSLNGRTTYVNATATERKGVEFDTSLPVNNYFRGRFVLNHLNAIYKEGYFNGLQLPGIAKNNHYIQLNWRPWGNELLDGGVVFNYRDQVAASDANQLKAPSFTTLDISLAGTFHFFSHSASGFLSHWWIKLANATDEKYVGSVIVNQTTGRSFEPASGRNLAAGLKIEKSF